MRLNYDIFGNLSEPSEPKRDGRRYKTMQELHGIKEGKCTCKTCDHLLDYKYHGKTYYKCELWIVSNSAATDIRLKNNACGKYERRSKRLTKERLKMVEGYVDAITKETIIKMTNRIQAERENNVLAEKLKDNDKSCDTCAFYNEDRDNQPCCYCAENSCWVKGEEE